MFKSNFKVLFLNKCCFIFKFIFIKMTEMGQAICRKRVKIFRHFVKWLEVFRHLIKCLTEIGIL